MSSKKLNTSLLSKDWETPSACSFRLALPQADEDRYKALPGQYLSLEVSDAQGIAHVREYSITHSDAQSVSICVKRVPNGLVSNLLCDHFEPGDSILITYPKGDFTLSEKDLNAYENLVFITGGSGITPIFSMLSHAIDKEYEGKIYLIYGNTSEDEIIFHQSLQNLKTSHCEFIFVLDEANAAWNGETGQLTENRIADIFRKYTIPIAKTLFFTSGPYRVIENVKSVLAAQMVKPAQLKTETFFVSANLDEISKVSHNIEMTWGNSPQTVVVSPGETILEAGLKAGIPLAHRCKTGNCGTCAGHLTAGEIYTPLRRDANSKEILTCQSYPLNDAVKVSLDKSRLYQWISNRNLGIAVSAVLAFFLFQFFSAPTAAEYLAKGPLNTGHETLECASCHRPAPGSTRQQLQFNARAFLGVTASDYTDFGNLPVASENCLECHNRPNDRHPTHRFMEPRFAEAREAIHPESCISCHQEHHGQRITITPLDYCMNCHRDIEIKDDPLEPSHASLIAQESWNTCLQCHDFHGNHTYEVPERMQDTISIKKLMEYAEGGEDPYGDLKLYIADSILKTR
jgi:ferredoxin-NADP reductase